jgi:eukaryotic-like serine/threonine-protein kinase
MSLAAGSRLGPYEILAPLGAGGMGEVYRARDNKLDREVAIKVLPQSLAGDTDALARFEREAKAVAALSHPNILAIHDFGTHEATAYAVTELLEGSTLREKVEGGPVSKDRAVDYALQICRGLSAAHEKGVIHRDLKPENIFVTKDGHVKILDFGLAKRMQSTAPGQETSAPTVSGRTEPGTVMGTVGYMSPEQVRGLPVDHRSDIFSFGTILYEMLSGRRAFQGATRADTLSAVLKEEPSALSDSGRNVPASLDRVVRHCLEKERENRFQSARDVAFAINEASGPIVVGASASVTQGGEGLRQVSKKPMRLLRGIAVAAAVLLVAAVGAWLWRRSTRERWIMQTATPEIERLVEAGQFQKAVALARQARAELPKDPALEKLWKRATYEASIETTPPGADVSIRPYDGDPNAWENLGKTPLKKIRVARSPSVWRISKPGFTPTFFLGFSQENRIKLPAEGIVPPGMAFVPGDETDLPHPFRDAPRIRLDDYFIDQHEVTNEDYKRFVDAGGYQRHEFWKQPFQKDGRAVSWDEALAMFRDATGRPGPATWEAGSFPGGLGKHPVAGVSWFEAAAYAEFVGKSLPTAYHWFFAAQTDFANLIIRGSNFKGAGTQAVGGDSALSGYGTTDMAGNVKEWCWNESRGGTRLIPGGGFGEPSYMFITPHAQSPWERRPNYGFRCVKLSSAPPPAASAKIEPTSHDYSSDKPVSDEVFSAFKRLYSYDKSQLGSKVEDSKTTEDGRWEKLSFNAAYGSERVVAYLFLPKGAPTPYQTVVYFPGSGSLELEKFDPASLEGWMDFITKNGRAFLFPIYKSTFERKDEYKFGDEVKAPALWRDHMIMWSKDLGRSLDYLQTRGDIDSSRLAYFGYSWGGGVAPVLLAVDQRFKTAILRAGGFWPRSSLPEADPINFVTHVKIPVLLLNDRYDYFFPLEASQLPLFRRLGTPEKDKRQVIYDSSHAGAPRTEVVRESLDWLDKYLGPVKR